MPQEQNKFEKLIYETMVSTAESEGIALTDAEKKYLAEKAAALLIVNEEADVKIAEELDVLITLDKDIAEGVGIQKLEDSGIPKEIDTERLKMILEAIHKHREAFVALDNMREQERITREDGQKGPLRH